MYGFIYNTLRSLVVENFGEQTWDDICEEADCLLMKDGIVDRHYYDENILAKVGTVAERTLGLPLEKILELFGAFFFDTCKRSGHSSMLRTLGHNLYGFLINLDSLHDHLSFTYTEMQAPSFLCEKTPSGLTLHYFSQRPGLSSIVIGIVKAVAKDFYNLEIEMEMAKYEETKERLAHHYMYLIEVKECNRDEAYNERLTGEMNNQQHLSAIYDDQEMSFTQTSLTIASPTDGSQVTVAPAVCPFSGAAAAEPNRDSAFDYERLREQLTQSGIARDPGMPTSVLPRISFSRLHSRRGSAYPVDRDFVDWPITQTLFQTCFPFHILFDRDLKIRFMGVSLNRLYPKAIERGEMLSEHFELTRPALALTYQNIRGSIHNIFIMRTRKNPLNGQVICAADALQFRGQMLPTSSREGALILFLGSPRVNSIEDLEHQGLYLSDIPVHDVTRDLILLNRHFRVEMGIAKELEETRRDLQIEKGRAEEEKRRADELLHAMLPRSVANELKKGLVASAMDYPEVTILFSDIKGFTNICNQCSPMQVVGMLNTLYTRFDSQLEKHIVYKVETIGDAYMVAGGLLDTSTDHAAAVTNMAFAMRDEAGEVMDPVNNKPLQIRIGVHSGGVVAGVVGLKMPRYCLFGDTVNTASRMESHGEPGYVHISAATYDLLKVKKGQYVFYNRGEIEVKGLGLKQTYFVEKPGKVGSELILVKSDSPPRSSSNLTVDTIKDLQQERFLRNPSFVKFNQCTIVNTPSTQQFNTCPSFETLPNTVSQDAPGLEMVKPARSPLSSSSIQTPIPEEREQHTGTPESQEVQENTVHVQQNVQENTVQQSENNVQQNQGQENGRVTSLFISNGANTIVSEPPVSNSSVTNSSVSKQKAKCTIS